MPSGVTFFHSDGAIVIFILPDLSLVGYKLHVVEVHLSGGATTDEIVVQ
jgi:hypothetical protein